MNWLKTLDGRYWLKLPEGERWTAEQTRIKKEEEEKKRLEAEKTERDKRKLRNWCKVLVVVVSLFIAFLFLKSYYLIENPLTTVLAIGALTGIILFLKILLNLAFNSSYGVLKEEEAQGKKFSKFNKLTVYFFAFLFASLIPGGLLFLVMRFLLRVW